MRCAPWPRLVPWLVLLALCAAGPGAAWAQAAASPAGDELEVHSDAACHNKPFNACVTDMWHPASNLVEAASNRIAPWFGAKPIQDIETETLKRWYVVNIPNDAFVRPSSKQLHGDSFYTGGFKYQHLFAGRERGSDVTQNVGMAVGVEVYTASDIHLRYPPDQGPSNDRPYANLFYIGTVYEAVRDQGEDEKSWLTGFFPWQQVIRLELDVNLLGPYGPGGAAQIVLHDTLSESSDTPQGWDSQIATQIGVDVTALYGQTLLTVCDFLKTIGYAQLRVGAVHRDATFGMRATVSLLGEGGFLDGIAFPQTFEHNLLSARGHGNWALSAYRGLSYRYVAYNALLQGGRWNLPHQRSPHTVEPKSPVVEQEGGVTLAYKAARLTYNLVRTSGEIRHDQATDATPHWVGNFTFVVEKHYR